MKQPDVNLEVGSGKHGAQTAQVLERLEAVLEQGPPGGDKYHRVLVVGDVNSTMAATLAAAKLGIPVAHVEAGLRSFDRSMPEEINRIVTDAVADLLLVSEPAGIENLRREGHSEESMHLVGNVMIDTLLRLLPRARSRDTLARPWPCRRPIWRRDAAPPGKRRYGGNARVVFGGLRRRPRRRCGWSFRSIPAPGGGSRSSAWRKSSTSMAALSSCRRWATSTSWHSPRRRPW